MAELKTKPTEESVSEFLAGIQDEQRRKDCAEVALTSLIERAAKAEPASP